jgi:uncharacterized protein
VTASVVYLDSSALVKLVIAEAESAALQAWIQPSMTLSSCALARTEVMRAVRDAGDGAIGRARDVLQGLDLIRLDDGLLEAAGLIGLPTLRSLDAVHLAAAVTLGDDLATLVTYEQRMAEGARALGLSVASPGA